MRTPVVAALSFASIVVAMLVVVAGVSGCPTTDPCADQVLYTGGGTDEVWLTMEDAKARATSDNNSPTITAPAGLQKIPKSDPAPTFTWDSPLKIASLSPAEVTHTRGKPGAFDALSALVIPSAHAHEPPVSSDVYLVEIPLDGEQCPVTIVTTELTVTLDDATWKRLQGAAGQLLKMSITSAYLQAGRVNEGPFKGTAVTFQVSP